ncbi:hypothetical protein [Streptosporangium subroseum]|nr:hypothetical protein [Streptosporangium subroseum]
MRFGHVDHDPADRGETIEGELVRAGFVQADAPEGFLAWRLA